eukprot:scaffold9074_cov141-Amphora_coffeaeformis.AAC.5
MGVFMAGAGHVSQQKSSRNTSFFNTPPCVLSLSSRSSKRERKIYLPYYHTMHFILASSRFDRMDG